MWTDSWRGGRQAETEDGRTTSPPVQPCPLSTPSDKISPLTSPSPGHAQNPALDRSQSAPASLLPPVPQRAPAAGSSQRLPPFHSLPGPAPPAPATLETPDPEALPQAPPPPTAGPSPLPISAPDSLDLPASAPKVAVDMGGAESLSPTAMEVGAAAGGGETGSSTLPSPPHPEPSTLQMGQELEETQTDDAKNAHVSASGEDEEEKQGVEMDDVCGERQCLAPLDTKLDPCLSPDEEDAEPHLNSDSSSDMAVATPLDALATPQAERDQPEGEQQTSCDTIPSLAAALKELHQLLVANKRMLSQDRSPSPSPSPSPSCREDADGVDDSPTAQSKPANLEHAQVPAAAALTIAADPEGVAAPLPTLSADSDSSSGYTGSTGRGEGEAMEGEQVSGESEVDGEVMEGVERRSGSAPEVSGPAQLDLQFREPPEGQQGRGVADGRAVGPNPPDPLPSPMEVAPPNPLLTAENPPCPTLAAPDDDSRAPPHVSSPPPPASAPCQSSCSPADPLPRAPSERFPPAHIQKIQAAGFSAAEAADALEQVQGHVELALLMLLARKITVPS